MAGSQTDISASLDDLDWGERARTGVVFHRQSARLNANPNGGDANTDGIDDSPTNSFRDTAVGCHEKILLPQSTHSLLFTENVFSLPFGFAVFVLLVSFWCLGLALWDNLSGGGPGNPLNVPVNVSHQVRAAQYLSILIALIMEEEVPTSTYLLRMIPRSSVERLGLSYAKFVISAISRLSVGYLFLLNVFLVVVQSDRVLDIFYDMLALNFVALVDDIAFKLAKYDVLGKHLRNASSAEYFRVEFEKRPYFFRKKMTIFLNFVYIFNLIILMGGLTAIALMQRNGHFQCESVTITFGEDIWENAWVQNENMVLVYSYFNGVYKQDGVHAGRPIYREMRKSMDTPFETKIGAEIKYCVEESAWVLTHTNIRKSRMPEESDCPWLLRSPNTEAFDLLEVSGQWSIWVGIINNDASIKMTCNGCKDDTECNLNGKCVGGKCSCKSAAGHYGMHCELENPCPRIIGARFNDTWSMLFKRNCEPLLEYGRPVYTLTHVDDIFKLVDKNQVSTIKDDDILALVFSGSRWFAIKIPSGKKLDGEVIEQQGREYHAFWDRAYDSGTIGVSDPTTRSYPVGVDTFRIGERGPQYGPFGVLYPMQEPPGKGAFRCDDNITTDSTIFANWFTSCSNLSDSSTVHMDHSHWDA